jgi:Neuraminidase (sialidase)
MGAGVRDLRTYASVLATALAVALLAGTAGATQIRFSAPVVMGFPPAGDDWEPAVTSDGLGNVYFATTHLSGVPGCGGCSTDSIVMQVSHDGGKTFSRPVPLTVNCAVQFDPNVKVNAAGKVFVSYLLGKDTVVQHSIDHGATWSAPVAVDVGIKQSAQMDKPGLAVRGDNVYVAFNIAQRFYVAASHDGGTSFTPVMINSNTIGWTLNGGIVVDSNGIVYASWVTVHQSGNAQGLQDVLMTRSTDRGASWTILPVDTNLPPGPACPTECGWDFLGTGSAIAVDQAGALYVDYNAPLAQNGAPHIWYRTSTDRGATWSARAALSTDTGNSWHVFGGIGAGPAGDVRVAWMDSRTGAFNVWYRSSTDGGVTWSSEVKVSKFRSGYSYVTTTGFAFPYGDYITLELDPAGHVQLAWGEGPNWAGPGNTLYSTR